MFLAEVGDKMATVEGTAIASIIIAGVLVGLSAFRRWISLALGTFVIAGWNLLLWCDLNDPTIGQQIVVEIGNGYAVKQLLAINLPFAVSIPLIIMTHRRRTEWLRRNDGACPKCNYDLRATCGTCPECGWSSLES